MDLTYDYLLTVAESLLQQSGLPDSIVSKYFSLKELIFAQKTEKLAKDNQLRSIFEEIICFIQKCVSESYIDSKQQSLLTQHMLSTGQQELLPFFVVQMEQLQNNLSKWAKKMEECASQYNNQAENEKVDLLQQIEFLKKESSEVKEDVKRLQDVNSGLHKQLIELKQNQEEEMSLMINKLQMNTQKYVENSIQSHLSLCKEKCNEELLRQLEEENAYLKQQMIGQKNQTLYSENVAKEFDQLKERAEGYKEEKENTITEIIRESQKKIEMKEIECKQKLDYLNAQIDMQNVELAEDEQERKEIICHLDGFCQRYQKLHQKYQAEVNPAQQFKRQNEELAYLADFLVYVTSTFENDNMWLIEKLEETTRQVEIAERAIVLQEKKSFYEDLEQTYQEMKQELQSTAKKFTKAKELRGSESNSISS